MKTITCKTCGIEKISDDFYYSKSSKNGKKYPSASCKKCDNKRSKDYHETNKEKRQRQHVEWRLKSRYSVDIEWYEETLRKQNRACAICGRSESRRLAVDHNHKTGQTRGLLCTNCNQGLGHFKDNIDFLKIAIDYLNDHA